MFLKEVAQVLDQLENDPMEFGFPRETVPEGIIELYQDVRDECVDESSSSDMILRLEAAQNKVGADPYNKKSPFYFMLLAYAYHTLPNWGGAILCAERAEAQFSIQGQKWYQAMNNWLSGLLYCVNSDLDTAQMKIDEATYIVSKINTDNINDGEYEYQKKYGEIIGTIDQSYSDLKNRVLMQASARVFSDIICRLKVPDNDPIIQECWEVICAMEPSDLAVINSQIDKLKAILKVYAPTPFDIIFLAHCYNLSFYAEGAKYTQRDALGVMAIEFKFPDYLNEMNEYNQSLVYWYLGLLCYNISDVEAGLLYLSEAKRLLNGFLEKYQEEYQYEDIEYIQNLQDDIGAWISELKSKNITPKPSVSKKNDAQSSKSNSTFGLHWGIPFGSRRDNQPKVNSSAPQGTHMKQSTT
ncbi:MAG: hypothetical protein WA821_14905, partial [Anaerolineales bacterium]